MLRDPHDIALEHMLSGHLKPLLAELRLTDLAVFADHVTNRRDANMAEIVATAAELHFAPGFIEYDRDSELSLDWSERPSVSVGVRIAAAHFTIRARLVIHADHAAVELQHIGVSRRNGRARRVGRAAMERAFRCNSFIAKPAMGPSPSIV